MTLFLHSMHGENPALHAGLEACPNSRHKSRKQEKQKTVIVLLVNICNVYIHAIDASELEKVHLAPLAYSYLFPIANDGMRACRPLFLPI